MTLFEPATGTVDVQPAARVTNVVLHAWLEEELEKKLAARVTNVVLHAWLEEELEKKLAALPSAVPVTGPQANRKQWAAWQEGLSVRFTLPEQLPALRALLVWDNLAGHKTVAMVLWLCAHGIMPLYTPLGGSWLNRAESIQRILKRRALAGQHPESGDQIGNWLQAVASHWNQHPTPFVWGGARRQRRIRQRDRQRRRLAGSGACMQQLPPSNNGRFHAK